MPVVAATGPTQPDTGLVVGGFVVLVLVPVAEYVGVWFSGYAAATVTGYWKGLAFFMFFPLLAGLALLFVPARASLGVRAVTGIVLLAYVASLGAHIATLVVEYTDQQRLEAQAIFGGLPALMGVLALGWAVVGLATRVTGQRGRATTT